MQRILNNTYELSDIKKGSAKKTFLFSILAVTVLALTTACGNGNGGGDGDGDGDGDVVAPADAPVGLNDIVDLGDLIQQEMENTSAGAQLGDPAELLAVAQDSGERIRAHIASVLDRVDDITDGDPDSTGTTPAGRPFARWDGNNDGVNYRFIAVRLNERRVRYFLAGKLVDAPADERPVPILTGVFVRDPDWAPRKGGGRFHLNLTGLTNLGRGPGLDGQLFFVFANKDSDRRGRRVFYRNVRERGSMDLPANYAADLIRQVGVGGRMRSVYINDIIADLPGREVYAMRTAWRAGEGGRAVAALARYNAGNPIVLGIAHECWDSDGLRTYYEDSYEANDAENPNEGATTDCVTLLQREDAPAADADGEDLDAELTEILEDSGANEVTEEEANSEDADIDPM